MRIADIKLENFQGIQDLKITMDGNDVSVYGDNGTGKTTIFNAITWLLFDKPSTGAKNWTPKTRDARGERHNMENAVTATFIAEDGRRVTLGKALREVWKRKRGSVAEEYAGNTVDYYVDGVPVKEKEYGETVTAHCGEAEARMVLTMPDYFPETMDWRRRREMLLDICGDITDQDVIAATPALKDLPDVLRMPGTADQQYTVEEYVKIAKARKTDINRQLESIPGRIDEATRAIPEDLKPRDQLEQQLKDLQAQADGLRAQIANAKAGAGEMIRAEIEKAKAELAQLRAQHVTAFSAANSEAAKAAADAQAERHKAARAAADARAEADTLRAQAERLTSLRNTILQEYEEARAVRWDDSLETCPTCGRRLPVEKTEAMRAEFNKRRSEQLAAINERGRKQASKEMIAELEAKAKEQDAIAAGADKAAVKWALAAKDAEAKVDTPPAFETTGAYKDAMDRIVELQTQLQDSVAGTEKVVQPIELQLQVATGAINSTMSMIAKAEAAEKQRERIAELEAQEKQLAAEYEAVERGIYLCETFIKAKVSMLTERINAKFRGVSFQLFTEQVNGGVAECCEVMVPCADAGGTMVPFSTANHAARVNAGLEIIETISDHMGRDMPVVVDNAESITNIVETRSQVIRLVVSEADKALRVEVA